MEKQGGTKNKFLKAIIIVLLIANVAIIATKFSNAHQKEELKNKYYTGEVLKPNHSANLIDYIDNETNVVISPININTSLNQLYNMQINNEKIGKYLNLSIEESNEFEQNNIESLTEEEKKQTSIDDYYTSLINNIKKYKDYRVADINKLTKEQKSDLILLINQAEKAYSTITEKSNNSIKFIKEYTLSLEEENINSYAIYELLIECLDNYETYTYKNEINNYSEIIYNSDLIKQSKKRKKQKYPEINNVNLQGVSFSDKKHATQEINSKIKENSNNKINYIVDEINIVKNELIQINSFNFESLWENNIEKEYIWDTEWKTFDNTIEIVETLHEKTEYYYENELAYAFIKPFEDNKYEFIGILPKEEGNFKLSNLNIEGLLQNKIDNEVSISLPKFKIKYEIDLKELYDEIGIQTNTLISFDELNEDVSINHIVSKTSITIDEKGTNGSSIRSTELETKDLNDSEQHIFLNRPFAFLIRDKETNNVLLIGKVTNPNN